MAILIEFTKFMLLRSTYGDMAAAVALAERMVRTYEQYPDSEVCQARLQSLKNIITEFGDSDDPTRNPRGPAGVGP